MDDVGPSSGPAAAARKLIHQKIDLWNPSITALPYTSSFLASVPVAKAKPTIPESAQMTEAMEHRVFEIVSGRFSAQSGLDNLALDLQHILVAKRISVTR
jgi:hypothetical protein